MKGMKGAKIQTGANISLCTVYHPLMLNINTAFIHKPDKALNASN